ncbi:hypothetical protein ASPBRDRAFT_506242 [Aspergillus brasiliensis CBS 101740]|uniref:Uncharacterized protein n=1 Tax=Aspergillus brasiliensis (strain CBS 101740 / IMI 381727 / IBT 21946) TaxID=767769 RepID=A0A1L9UPT2_ASPBC|nr:hypothetical protein ASPBRDRAFT_506242 [Aspergillus brasiliensis CBS 101740]
MTYSDAASRSQTCSSRVPGVNSLLLVAGILPADLHGSTKCPSRAPSKLGSSAIRCSWPLIWRHYCCMLCWVHHEGSRHSAGILSRPSSLGNITDKSSEWHDSDKILNERLRRVIRKPCTGPRTSSAQSRHCVLQQSPESASIRGYGRNRELDTLVLDPKESDVKDWMLASHTTMQNLWILRQYQSLISCSHFNEAGKREAQLEHSTCLAH